MLAPRQPLPCCSCFFSLSLTSFFLFSICSFVIKHERHRWVPVHGCALLWQPSVLPAHLLPHWLLWGWALAPHDPGSHT